jgi:hypothetical protein
MRIMAGRYEGYAGLANALHATSQEMSEIAAKFSQTGYDTSEYGAAGSRYFALHTYMIQLIGTVGTGTNTTTAGGNAAYAAVADVAAGNTAAKLAVLLPAVKIEVQNMAAHAADMINASKMFQSMSLGAGFVAAGYSAQSESAGTDFAAETAKLAAAQIKAQAATAMVAQASVVDQAQLALLQ